ncbi:MAG: RHS repeat-associated core domain-containing protein [Pyrinomonadaceae bacterium]
MSRRDFRPYGEEIARTNYGSDSVREKFATYERDDETGLDFAQARMFSSPHGRMTSPDPWAGTRVFPQTLNRYAYVMNNPLRFADPSGLCGRTAGSEDGTPCIWLVDKDGNYKSVSQKEYGDGSGFAGFSVVENREDVYFQLTTLNGDYADDPEYKDMVERGAYVGLGANGRFVDLGGDPVRILDEEDGSFDINPTKALSASLTSLNAGRLYASGIIKLAPGVIFALNGPSPEEGLMVPVAAWGLYNLHSGYTNHKRSNKLFDEALREKWSDASWKNLYGPLPYGDLYDDPSEPGAKEFWKGKARDWYRRPIEFISEIGTITP